MSGTLPDGWAECAVKALHALGHGDPLPPTAEQTSIARFNALADQIREIADQLRLLIDDERSRFATLTAHQDRIYNMYEALRDSQKDLHKKIDRDKDFFSFLANTLGRIEQMQENTQNIIAIHYISLSSQMDHAVAKRAARTAGSNKAAPLVGKKGTGRKG